MFKKKFINCQARVQSPKVQSPKIKIKRTWADTIIKLESRHKIHLDRFNHGHCVKEKKTHTNKGDTDTKSETTAKTQDKTKDKTRPGERMRSGINQQQWTSSSPSPSSSFENKTTSNVKGT